MRQSISPIDRKTSVLQPERALEEKQSHANWTSSEKFNTHRHTHSSRPAKMSIMNFGKRKIVDRGGRLAQKENLKTPLHIVFFTQHNDMYFVMNNQSTISENKYCASGF